MATSFRLLRQQHHRQLQQLQAQEEMDIQALREQYQQLDTPLARATLLSTYVRKRQQVRQIYAQKRQRLINQQQKESDNLTGKLVGADEWERQKRLILTSQFIRTSTEFAASDLPTRSSPV